MRFRFRPKAVAPVTAGVVLAAAGAGAVAGVEGLAIGSAAAVAGTAVVGAAVGTAAFFGGKRIIRRHTSKELELASQIQDGLETLLEFLTQSLTGKRLPATATLLIQPQEVVGPWMDQLEDEKQVAQQFPDDRLATSLSALRLKIGQLRAYRTSRQIEFLKFASENAASGSNAALLISLLGVGLTRKQAELLLRTASDDGLTLQEAVWLLLLIGDYPDVNQWLEKLLLEIRASSDDDRAKELFALVQAGSIDALQELLAKGVDVVDEILSKDELEQRFKEALQACGSIIK
jgi:hypothetical protein